jgi:hypothetical protein
LHSVSTTGGHAVGWLIGSIVTGLLYDQSRFALVVFAVAAQLVALPVFVVANRLEELAASIFLTKLPATSSGVTSRVCPTRVNAILPDLFGIRHVVWRTLQRLPWTISSMPVVTVAAFDF